MTLSRSAGWIHPGASAPLSELPRAALPTTALSGDRAHPFIAPSDSQPPAPAETNEGGNDAQT